MTAAKCSCRADSNNVAIIYFCPLHEAARELLEALTVVSADHWINLSLTEQDVWLRKSAEIIKKAESL